MAHTDSDFRLVAAVNNRSGRFSLNENQLDRYFVPKRELDANALTVDYLRSLGRGLAYSRTAFMYIFQKTV